MRGRFINIHNILIKTVNIATLIDLLQHKWVEINTKNILINMTL